MEKTRSVKEEMEGKLFISRQSRHPPEVDPHSGQPLSVLILNVSVFSNAEQE